MLLLRVFLVKAEKAAKKAVVSAMEALQFPIINLDDTRSWRSYNCYRPFIPLAMHL